MFSFWKDAGDVTKISLDTFVSLLQKPLPVELRLFNMDCLKNIPITEKSTYTYSVYYEHRPSSCKLHYIVWGKPEFTGAINVGGEKVF